jgi:hypothetical protein
MFYRICIAVGTALIAGTLAGCSREDAAQAPAPEPNAAVAQEAAAAPAAVEPVGVEEATAEFEIGAAAGLTWTIPRTWESAGERPMRVATYRTPSAAGDADGGEVAVFHFGPTQGGTVEANVQRWFAQFDSEEGQPAREVAERQELEIAGLAVTRVETRGTYNAAAGPMAPRADLRPGYALIGAIVEGPEGAVFFKFTGPEATVEEQRDAFQALLESLQPN